MVFSGYSDRGFQKDKKKLTDIGFLSPDSYRDGLSLGSDQNLIDLVFFGHWID